MPDTIQEISAQAKRMRSRYAMCDHCIGRMFARRARLTDHARLGKRLRGLAGYAEPKKCTVCKGIFAHLREYCDEMVRLTQDIEFSTFLVGTTLKPSVLDADDNVRSRYRLRGTQSAKTDVTHTLSKMFAQRTHTRASMLPDVTIKVDLRQGFVSIEPRTMFVQARYTKESRSIPQKHARCTTCSGKGCMLCGHRGIIGTESVEAKITEFLCNATHSRQARFLWCGSEETESVVTGRGRTFFVKLLRPTKRNAALPKKRDLGGVTLYCEREVDLFPKVSPRFSFSAAIRIDVKDGISDASLRALRGIAGDVTDYAGSKRQVRTIHSVSYKRRTKTSFDVRLQVDSGFPLRRFVECSDVSPNLTDLLETQCKYVRADFSGIKLAR